MGLGVQEQLGARRHMVDVVECPDGSTLHTGSASREAMDSMAEMAEVAYIHCRRSLAGLLEWCAVIFLLLPLQGQWG
jgi:hypothetical protein